MSAVITLTAAEVASIPVEKAHCMVVAKKSLMVYKKASGELTVAPNACAHMGLRMSADIEDSGKVVCSAHGAKLDMRTLAYTSGPTFLTGLGTKVPTGTAHPAYKVTLAADGSAALEPPPEAEGKACCSVC